MTTACNLRVARVGNGYRIRIEGRGTAQESPALAAFVSQCNRADEQTQIIVDLSACEYLDSTFLGCLVTLDRACQKHEQRPFQVLANAEKREKLLGPTNIDSLLMFVERDPENMSDFVTMEPNRLNETQFGRHVLEAHRALAGVPSAHAELLQEIAAKLERELEEREKFAGKPGGLRETV